MMTWKLWSMLKKPPQNHPLFKRMNKAQATPLPRHINIGALRAHIEDWPATVFVSVEQNGRNDGLDQPQKDLA